MPFSHLESLWATYFFLSIFFIEAAGFAEAFLATAFGPLP
jgi:hypothetical protein